jgi:ATP-dependent 26S proteasome regulatory subunit
LLELAGLTELEPGPLPIITKELWAEIKEWIASWKHAEALREAGLMAPGALLLFGPTGSGKTSLARAILKYMDGRPGLIMEAHNVLTSGFGMSARNLAAGFQVAEHVEAMLVVEEIDALGISRHGNSHSCATEENKITIALMRHLEAARIPIIATTNFHESLDPALLRRFELQLEVPLIDAEGRSEILKKILGRDAPADLVALPLVNSIRLAHRIRRAEFIAGREARGRRG